MTKRGNRTSFFVKGDVHRPSCYCLVWNTHTTFFARNQTRTTRTQEKLILIIIILARQMVSRCMESNLPSRPGAVVTPQQEPRPPRVHMRHMGQSHWKKHSPTLAHLHPSYFLNPEQQVHHSNQTLSPVSILDKSVIFSSLHQNVRERPNVSSAKSVVGPREAKATSHPPSLIDHTASAHLTSDNSNTSSSSSYRVRTNSYATSIPNRDRHQHLQQVQNIQSHNYCPSKPVSKPLPHTPSIRSDKPFRLPPISDLLRICDDRERDTITSPPVHPSAPHASPKTCFNIVPSVPPGMSPWQWQFQTNVGDMVAPSPESPSLMPSPLLTASPFLLSHSVHRNNTYSRPLPPLPPPPPLSPYLLSKRPQLMVQKISSSVTKIRTNTGASQNIIVIESDSEEDAEDTPTEGKNTRYRFTTKELQHLAESYTQEEVAKMYRCR